MNASRGDALAGLSQIEFLAWAAESATMRNLLHQLAFGACILFGVKPESPHLERRIVEWHWKQATVSFSVGEVGWCCCCTVFRLIRLVHMDTRETLTPVWVGVRVTLWTR